MLRESEVPALNKLTTNKRHYLLVSSYEVVHPGIRSPKISILKNKIFNQDAQEAV